MFVKGASGNPGGRPKRSPEELAKWIEAARGNLEVLIDIRENATKDADRLKAVEIMEDRAYGKPVQTVDANVETQEKPVDLSKATKEQKEALAALAVANFEDDKP